ncbi:hypothetical protein [Marispirochaeta aestuarii]|uniref:hypothetical protein n=1 Tax=Marispirochaeta aestuarii TaxID=1963862 RepID=UPI0029C91D81|nr:hypothetical protein [Marispirochaeta aestuarii]
MRTAFQLYPGIALLLVLTSGLFAQAPEPGSPEGPYTVEEIDYHIDGITRKGALMKELGDLKTGISFQSENELQNFIAEQRQLLLNLRQLKESSRIEYSVGEKTGGHYPVRLDIYTEDSWNIIVLPIPEYDSNNGFSLTLKYRDLNLFGTLERFALDVAWERQDGDTNNRLELEFMLPFQWLEHQWHWDTAAYWEYTAGEHDLESYTSVGVDLPIKDYTPTLSFRESYNYESTDIDKNWITSRLELAEDFSTGLFLPGFGQFIYTPGIYTEIDYKFDKPISREKEGPGIGYGQLLTAGQVDWIGNFRKGVDLRIENTNTWNLQHLYWNRDARASLSGFYPLPFRILFWPFMVSGRVAGFAEFDGEFEEEAASYIRGIRDLKMGEAVEYGGFINTDLTMRAFTIPDFVEGQGSVFFDAGWVKEQDTAFDPDKHFKMGLGLEAIGFPFFARGYYIRASLGIDLKAVIDQGDWGGENYELFIVLGHHY